MITLSGATLAGQLLGFLVTPLFSRLYTPADFGLFQLFVSIVSIVAGVSCFSYHYAILLPERDEDSAHIVVLCSFLIAATVLFTTIVLFFSSGYIGNILHAPGFSPYLSLLPFAIGFGSFAYMFGNWLSRKEAFGTIAKANIASSFTGKGITGWYGFASPSPFGLIFGSMINDATICLIFGRRMLADFRVFSATSYQQIRELAVRYKKFPQYSLGSDFAGMAAVQATPFLLAAFFSPIIVGYYSMAYLVLRLPSKLIGNAIGTVFFQQASAEKIRTGGVKTVVREVHTRLVSLGMFACLVVMITGPELFSFVLGSRWVTAGEYARIFAPWFFVSFISVPLTNVFNVLEEQEASLGFSLFLLASSIVSLVIGGLLGNPLSGMILLSATGVIFWGWMNMYSLKIAGVSPREAGIELGKYFSIGLCAALPLILARAFSVSAGYLLLIAVIVSFVYYAAVIYHDVQLRDGFIRFAGRVFRRIKK